MLCKIKKLNNLKQYEIEQNEWNNLPKHDVRAGALMTNCNQICH